MIPFNPFSALASKVYAGLAVASLTFAAVQTVRIEGLRLWPLSIEGYAAANARLAGDIERIKDAQDEALAKAVAARNAAENQSAELARKADQDDKTIDDLRAGAARFAAARAYRLRPEAAGGPASGAAAPAESGPAPDRDGPGADAVVLTRPEYDELVSNSLRLERVRQWGESLITRGLAVPEVDFVPVPAEVQP